MAVLSDQYVDPPERGGRERKSDSSRWSPKESQINNKRREQNARKRAHVVPKTNIDSSRQLMMKRRTFMLATKRGNSILIHYLQRFAFMMTKPNYLLKSWFLENWRAVSAIGSTEAERKEFLYVYYRTVSASKKVRSNAKHLEEI
ncbi:hypothetical protein CEXT_563851 [Caerostris extrusa]|uniref:Uncharacterized protein n=1 Tax=Caerostris extrusa TaxID=172846 RepID=A0AAV4Y6V9_CAEEX|nr:hypothetical protein CEXT_563851 [Caerostris extrusa]